MKTIVAGVDFTSSSYNAAHYAALLAQKLNCRLVLLNLFEAPLVHSNNGLYFISKEDIKKKSEDKLRRYYVKFHAEHPRVKLGYLAMSGSFRDEISEFLAHHQVQCVVMGLASKGRFSKFLYGSHSTDIAGKMDAPVIIVPEQYKEHRLKKMLLAVDNRDWLDAASLKPFSLLMAGAKANGQVLHVRTDHEVFEPAKNKTVTIRNNKYPISVVTEKNIERGVKKFVSKNNVDLVAVLSHPHSAFYDLFWETNTKKIAFSTRVPVMAMHEKEKPSGETFAAKVKVKQA